MGLIEKRLVKRMTEEVLPRFEAELLEIAGTPLRYMVDWTHFLPQAAAVEGLEQWGLPTIAQAFRLICRDDLGREAVAASISTITITQWSASWPTGTIDQGSLQLLWDWGGAERFAPEQLEAHVSGQL